MIMACYNCGLERPEVLVSVTRFRNDGAQHTEHWCLECIQGNNPVRKEFNIPLEWK